MRRFSASAQIHFNRKRLVSQVPSEAASLAERLLDKKFASEHDGWVANDIEMRHRDSSPEHDSVGAWAKRCYFAGRALMDSLLRPYGIGSTQWYVLHRLANAGPTMQRDLVTLLQIEKPTLSGVISTLVAKGLVEQIPDAEDQRQRLLRLSASGKKLWKELPDPATLILSVAFHGFQQKDLETARRVLQGATERLHQHILERNKP